MRNTDHSFLVGKSLLVTHNSAQFAGKAIEISPSRLFNCAYVAIDDYRAFSETMFLLLGGSGVGYSVQARHISQLPQIQRPQGSRKYVIQDNRIGFSEAIRTLMKAYFFGRPKPIYNFEDIRPKGSPLKTSGGKAPGPEPLKATLYQIENILKSKDVGDKLTSLEVFDIQCHIAESVLAGGIRRSSTITLFDPWDYSMLTAKTGEWYLENPQRAMSNISAVLDRRTTTKEDFEKVFSMTRASNSGEPGFAWTNDPEIGLNPCAEISLPSKSFCNLVEIYTGDNPTQIELEKRAEAASFIATLQASYTDFFYLRPEWKKNAEKEALLGVSLTGIGSLPEGKSSLDFKEVVNEIRETNEYWAEKLEINTAARLTAIKPSGTTSLLMGTSPGVHAWYAPFYKRRLRLNKTEPLYTYLKEKLPELVEDDIRRPQDTAIVVIPYRAPKDAIYRSEGALETLSRVGFYNKNWIHPGYTSGPNQNNVSCTINLKENEWDVVKEWLWDNRDLYTGISLIPYDNGSYVQPPMEEITETEYLQLLPYLKKIDLTEIKEYDDNTDLVGELACSGGGCDIT